MKITPEYMHDNYSDEEFEDDKGICIACANNIRKDLPRPSNGVIKTIVAGGFFSRILRKEYTLNSDGIPVLHKGDIDLFPVGEHYVRDDYWRYIRDKLTSNYERYENYYTFREFLNYIDESYSLVSDNCENILSEYNYAEDDLARKPMMESAHHGITVRTNSGNNLNIILDPNCVSNNIYHMFGRFDMIHARIAYQYDLGNLYGFKENFFAAKYRLMQSNPKKPYQKYRIEKFKDEGYSLHEF